MRVLFVAHSFPRFAGDAAGSFLLRLAVALRAEDVEVTVLAPAGASLQRRERIEGIEVSRFAYAPPAWQTLAYSGDMAVQVRRSWKSRLALVGLVASGANRVWRETSRLTPDVVHAHWWFPGGLAATLAPRAGAFPFITTMHGTDVRIARDIPQIRFVLGRVLARSDACTTVSSWLAREIHAMVPNRPTPVVAPMPANTELFVPPESNESRAPNRLLFVGRLNRQKGIETLLRALPFVDAALGLDIVGDGPDREALARLAVELGIERRLAWHGAMVQSALPLLYQRATALVVPSRDEGLGLVAVEAQLCETPVIAANSGGLGDVVEPGRTGLLFPPDEPQALAAEISSLLARSDRGLSLGAAGRISALDTFAPSAVARRYAELYRSVAARTPG